MNFLWPNAIQTLFLRIILNSAADSLQAWALLLVHPEFVFDSLSDRDCSLLPMVWKRLHQLKVSHPLMPRMKGVYRQTWLMNQVSQPVEQDPLLITEPAEVFIQTCIQGIYRNRMASAEWVVDARMILEKRGHDMNVTAMVRLAEKRKQVMLLEVAVRYIAKHVPDNAGQCRDILNELSRARTQSFEYQELKFLSNHHISGRKYWLIRNWYQYQRHSTYRRPSLQALGFVFHQLKKKSAAL